MDRVDSRATPPLRRATSGWACPVGARLTLAALLALSAGCQVMGGFESFAGEAGPPPHPCDVLPAAKTDPRGLTALVLVKDDGRCFWANRTETTVSEYGTFLHAGKPAWNPLTCGWKTAPSSPADTADDACRKELWGEFRPWVANAPIRCVDWCDAQTYCEWLGGSLCTAQPWSGGTMEPESPDDWRALCAGIVPENFPYGASLKPGTCNLGQREADCSFDRCGPEAAGTVYASCVSPSGALDALGNVAEWTRTCEMALASEADKHCLVKGGSFADVESAANCNRGSRAVTKRSDRNPFTGLRCCFPLTAAERLQSGVGP